MEENRGVLYIGSAPRAALGGAWAAVEPGDGGDGALDRARAALWELRRRCGWICVAADRAGAGAAAALAAQLPVERLALAGSRLFDRAAPRPRGRAARLERFARRNLSLVVAEVLLIGASDREIRGFASLLGKRRVCALDGCGEKILTAPWSELNEKNLLLPEKCV